MFYDKNGNQVSKAVMTNKPFGENVTGDYTVSQNSDENIALYEYNCYNQLVGVDTNGIISSYTYAPDGMRASKTVAGNTTNYVYDNANVMMMLIWLQLTSTAKAICVLLMMAVKCFKVIIVHIMLHIEIVWTKHMLR